MGGYGVELLVYSTSGLDDPLAWREALTEHAPVVILTGAPIPNERLVEWADAVESPVLVLVQWDAVDSPTAPDDVRDCDGRVRWLRMLPDGTVAAAFKRAEQAIVEARSAGSLRATASGPAGPRPLLAGRSVTLVGCGAVNLVTALALAHHGCHVEVFDASPDPRENQPWHRFGATRGGYNARMFTATEADQYSAVEPPPPGGTVFEAPPARLGWDIRRADLSSAPDQEWVRDYQRVPAWLAQQYEDDILSFNRESAVAWEQLFEVHPELAGTTHLRRGILRVYSTAPALLREIHRHRAVRDIITTYTADEVRDRFGAFSKAGPGVLAGGIFVSGFTLDVHRFVATGLRILEAHGARLHFDAEVTGLHRNRDGLIEALEVGDDLVAARNIVISPGANSGRLMADLGLGGHVAGVLGLWHALPNGNGQEHSIKVCRPGTAAPDANITVGEVAGLPSLIVGSGYGFVGTDAGNIDREHLRVIQRSVDAMMRTLLPDSYDAAGGPEWLKHEPVYCVRPWTATSLGLFDVRAAASGLCVVTGGHNTGGFAQAPAVANAVLASLGGESHPMHQRYWPERFRSLFQLDAVKVSG
jgi:D-amino-acid dehydrogenase